MGDIQDIAQHQVFVTLDKERELYYGLRGLRYLATKYGSINKFLGQFSGGIKDMDSALIDSLVDYVYAGLMRYNPDMSPDSLLDLLDISNFQRVFDKCSEAFANNSGSHADPTNPVVISTGLTSTPPDAVS